MRSVAGHRGNASISTQNPDADMNPPPLNIARVITRLPQGGIELRMAAILPRLAAAGCRCRALCIHERGPVAEMLEDAGIPVDLIRFDSRFSPRGIRQMAAWLREHQVDVLHAHMYRSYMPATIAAHLARTPVMLGQVHNVDTWDSWRQRAMDRLLWRWRTGMLAVSEEVKRDVTETLGCPEDFVRVLYNGIDLERFEHAPFEMQLRAELGCPPGGALAVVVARLHPQKNHRLLLSALRRLGDARKDFKAALIGEGKMEDELRALTQEWGLSDCVRFAGLRDDVERYYKAADFAILPSDKEGFSNVVIEAMAGGCPVVATDVGGNREAILDGVTGYIVPPNDEAALAAALEKMLAEPKRREEMAKAAVERARVFSLDAMAEATLRIYRETLDE
ncbi:glycosyltransferase [Candidatus Sumerlaeota bacterium]|nr:glycosyltransferase [Candidatus Sumerlaeota bacterium]